MTRQELIDKIEDIQKKYCPEWNLEDTLSREEIADLFEEYSIHEQEKFYHEGWKDATKELLRKM